MSTKRKPEQRTLDDVQHWISYAVVKNNQILTYVEHFNEELAQEIARVMDGTIQEVPAKVFDHRVNLFGGDDYIQRPELPKELYEVVEVVEFRVSAKGEPYYCRYHGFGLAGTFELLYFVKPPRFNQTEYVYSKPATYTVQDTTDD